jgi:hypothetical protein
MRQPEFIILAGVSVKRTDVEWIAWGVDEPTASRLLNALKDGTQVVGLEEVNERAILAILEDPPVGLKALRCSTRSQSSRSQRLVSHARRIDFSHSPMQTTAACNRRVEKTR